jgi:anti-anti-sigma factor
VTNLARVATGLGDSGSATFSLDLTDVTFMDAAGIALIFDLAERCSDGDCLGIICPRQTPVRRLLELAGLTRHETLRVFDSEEEARKATQFGE